MRRFLAVVPLAILSIAPAFAANPPPMSPELQALDKAVGNWTYEGENRQTAYNKAASHYRVIYRYPSSTRSTVKFQISNDGAHWQTLGQGTGIRARDSQNPLD